MLISSHDVYHLQETGPSSYSTPTRSTPGPLPAHSRVPTPGGVMSCVIRAACLGQDPMSSTASSA